MRINRKTKTRIRINCLYKLQSKRPPMITFPSAAPVLWFRSGSCTPAGTPPAGASYTWRALDSRGIKKGQLEGTVWRGVRGR